MSAQAVEVRGLRGNPWQDRKRSTRHLTEWVQRPAPGEPMSGFHHADSSQTAQNDVHEHLKN